MQAADLLAIIVPGTPGQPGASGQANGVGKGAGKAEDGLFADSTVGEGQGAEAVNPFAQALAALMAAPGQGQVQTAAAEPQPEGQVADAEAGAEAANKGLQTALAATAKAGAPAHGLIKLLAETTPSSDTDEAAPEGDQPTPTTVKTLPPTAQADEALARRLESPPPRSERAQALANGPHLPPWASPPTTEASAPVDVPEPEAGEIAADQTAGGGEAQTPIGEEPPAALALAASETVARPASPPRAEGKALGRAEAKDKSGEEIAPEHHAQGVGKGLATAPGQLKKAESEPAETDMPPAEPQLAQVDAPDNGVESTSLALADPTHAAGSTPAHAEAGKLAPHTVAHLAEQIVSKSEGRATRFDVQLDPAGLGKVDVKIEIGRGGEISAAMSFDNPVAAAEMRARAGELRSALEQAGFDLGKGGLSFDFSGQNPGQNLWDRNFEAPRPSWARGAFTDLAALAETPSQAHWRQIDADSVDVTV